MSQMLKTFKMYTIYSSFVLLEAIVLGTICQSFYVAFLIGLAMFLYMDMAEIYARFYMDAKLIDNLDGIEVYKVKEAFGRVRQRMDIKYPYFNKIKVYVLQDDTINAYSFGRRSIGITRGAMNLDSHTIEAILAHEVGHSIYAHMFLYRFLFANLIGLTLVLALFNLIFLVCLGIFILILVALKIFHINFITYQIVNSIFNLVKRIMNLMQNLLLTIGQTLIGAVSRKNEYTADAVSFELGYGQYLLFYLKNYVLNNEICKPRTLTDVLYATHPDTSKRIKRLEYMKEKK